MRSTREVSRHWRPGRRLLPSSVVAVLVLAAAFLVPAAATAAGGNDTWPHADRIRVGSEIVRNTSRATQQRIDRRLNRECGAPQVGASVWFRYRGATERRLVLDASGSGYSVGMMVFRGRPSRASFLTCGPMQVGFKARAGQRYYVMVFSDSSRRGGRLELTLDVAKPPRISVDLDDTAVLNDDGTVTLSGTSRCTNATFSGLDATLRQLVGRFYVIGYQFTETGPCDGKSRPFEVAVVSDNGIFGTEPATVDLYASACGPFRCAEVQLDDEPVTIQEAP